MNERQMVFTAIYALFIITMIGGIYVEPRALEWPNCILVGLLFLLGSLYLICVNIHMKKKQQEIDAEEVKR